MEYFSVADVCRMVGWDARKPTYYQRVWSAVGTGAAGKVQRQPRGWVLTARNCEKLVGYLKWRWKIENVE